MNLRPLTTALVLLGWAAAGCRRSGQPAPRPRPGPAGSPGGSNAAPSAVCGTPPATQMINQPLGVSIGMPAPATGVAATGSYEQASAAVEALRQAGSFGPAAQAAAALRNRFPERAQEAGALEQQVKATRREAAELVFALLQLDAADPLVRSVAADKLSQAGETARILLRQAVREQDPPIAAAAAELLANLGDPTAGADIAARLAVSLQRPERARLAASLSRLAGPSDLPAVAALWPRVRDEPRFAQRDIAALVDVVGERAVSNDWKTLDERAALPGLHDELRAYIQFAALNTNDAAAAAWGGLRAFRHDLAVPGINGTYFADLEMRTRAFSRIDARLEFGDGAIQLADGRRDNIAVRWSGRLAVAQGGQTVFRFRHDDGIRLAIDGRMVLDRWDVVGDSRLETDLTAGSHDFVLEYKACPPPNTITAWWTPAGGSEAVLSDAVLSALPTRDP